MTAARRRREYHPTFPGDWSGPVTSRAQASVVVGDFFERLGASMVGGHRITVPNAANNNPDIQAKDRQYESKASQDSRWIVKAAQWQQCRAKGVWYQLWRYRRPRRHGVSGFCTVQQLREYLAANVIECYVLPAQLVVDLIAQTTHPDPVDSGNHWGSNYHVSVQAFRRLTRREHRLQRRLIVARRIRDRAQCCGLKVATFPAWWIRYREDVDRVPHPTRRGWHATDEDVALAWIALEELKRHCRKIGLVPAPRPNFVGHKIRVIEACNPRWYRTLAHRRPMKRDGKNHSIRIYVVNALQSIVTTRYIRPSPKALDLEVLEVLHADEDLGTDQTAAP